jgi:hypothetical protein
LQDYNIDWTMLLNVQMFLGNVVVALLFGALFSIFWELPFARLQKLLIGALVGLVAGPPNKKA